MIMYDRPTANELITAARSHIETNILPLAKTHNFKLYFQTLVAVNVMRIVGRELEWDDQHRQQYGARLQALLGADAPVTTATPLQAHLAEANTILCQQIRAGERDNDDVLFDHLLQTSIEQLTVANPKFLATLAEEDA